MVGYNHSMEWTWNPYGLVHMEWTWNPYGPVHMEWTWNPYEPVHMESIWNGDGIHMEWVIPCPFHVHSIWIPCAYGMRKWLGPQPKSFHMDSIWINPGRVKTSMIHMPTQVKSSIKLSWSQVGVGSGSMSKLDVVAEVMAEGVGGSGGVAECIR